MRLLVDSDLKPAGGVIGAGFDEFRWPRPVRPLLDTATAYFKRDWTAMSFVGRFVLHIEMRSRILEVRPSKVAARQRILQAPLVALNISPPTVEIHRANIMKKLGVRNLVQRVRKVSSRMA